MKKIMLAIERENKKWKDESRDNLWEECQESECVYARGRDGETISKESSIHKSSLHNLRGGRAFTLHGENNENKQLERQK